MSKKPKEKSMFKQLRNRIVGIAMISTTVVLLIAFSAIYMVATYDYRNRSYPKISDSSSTTIVKDSVIDENADNNPAPRKTTSDKDDSSVSDKTENDSPDSVENDSKKKQSEPPMAGFFRKEEVDSTIRERLHEDRTKSLRTLLVSLIVTGVCIESLIFLLALYLANETVKPVEETYNAQRQFVANASHEIKTPLAVIQANLEAADIQGNVWIDNAMKKTEELADLNGQLLALARAEAEPESKMEKTEVELDSLIKDLTDPLLPQIKKKKAKLTVSGHSNRKININLQCAKQILNILLDNAIKYCDKKIEVEVGDKSVKVKNDGTTIDKDEIKHLFERFYQVDKTKKGVGLGLAIANEVAKKNDWKLSAESDDKSTSFIINF